MKIHIHSLGCKVNQYESQAMEALLTQRGHTISSSPVGCDAIIVNTCAVTAESVRKSRQALRRLRGECPDAIIALCGCWPQTEPEAAREMGADILFGSGDRVKLTEAIEAALSEKVESIDNAMKRRQFELLPAGSPSDRTRALLKIEDGCVNFCSYCVIPYARGPVRSLPLEDAVRQAAELSASGYKEIVLTGIEIASYGRDLPGKPTISDVVEAVAKAAPECRIRLGSLEPRCITGKFADKLASLPNLCPHFHLSLQSGCDRTLKAMNRKYDTARFYESVETLRSRFRDCGITADLITGFPGETEEDFGETLRFLEKCAFSSVHVFPYSRRGGTPADTMPDQVPKAVKQERAHRASKLTKATQQAFLEAQVGMTMPVLFEQEEDGMWQGHAPNYTLVRAKGTALHNLVINVLITAAEDGSLLGEVIL